MNQQLDIDGNRHDIAPEHETQKLFDSAPQIRGQIALDTDARHPRLKDVLREAGIGGQLAEIADSDNPWL